MKKLGLNQYQSIALFAGFCCMGYITSLFLTYGFVVMPGLATIDDAAFVKAFQGLETRFQNTENYPRYQSVGYGNIPAFIAFSGALLFSVTALVLGWKKKFRNWILAALILFGTGLVTTLLYNLPSNIAIFNAGDPNLIDVTKVRDEFNETAWLNWNHFRTITTFLAGACLAKALYQTLRIKQ